jgi:CRISPR-associated protein Cas1
MGHPAFRSDMMEEFRSIIVDAVVLNLVFNNKLTPDDFTLPEQEGEPCLLNPKGRAVFIRYLEVKMNAAVQHPISQLKLDYRRCMEYQVNHLARIIRGREERYQPMIMR